ncbi:hypothetical protein JB92DRAFT_278202 [Gautieria morchelliformis]|nr:hypothetical protein JB92DRAFT_278202 [Gautieria morchelliformis]
MEFSLATLVSAGRIVNSTTFASLAFLLYDHALTFDAEVRLVWSHPVYTSPSVSLKVCDGFHWWETTSEAIAVLSVELILMTRVHLFFSFIIGHSYITPQIYAVYDRNRKLLFCFGAIFVAEIAGTLVIVDTGLPRGIPRPQGFLAGCFVSAQPPLYFLTWVPALVCESILCLFMLYKAWTMYMNKHNSVLLSLIIRDSVLYFLTVFATLLINCLVWAFASQNFLEVALSWAVAIPCSLGSRLLFNMQERMARPETSQRVSTFVEMETFRVEAPPGLSVGSTRSSV